MVVDMVSASKPATTAQAFKQEGEYLSTTSAAMLLTVFISSHHHHVLDDNPTFTFAFVGMLQLGSPDAEQAS